MIVNLLILILDVLLNLNVSILVLYHNKLHALIQSRFDCIHVVLFLLFETSV